MKTEQQQLLANIIRDAGIVLIKCEKTSIRHKALENIKKNAKLLDGEI